MTSLNAIKEKLKPVRYDAKNLKKEFKAIHSVLVDVKADDWQKREALLRKIAGMALSHEIDDRDFADLVQRELGRALAEQITDLRSQIVKAACVMVVVLSEELGDYFDTTLEQFLLPSLIRQLPVKALPIRESAHECISQCLAHRTNVKILRVLYNASTEKEKIIRGRASEYLAYISANWDRDVLQKSLGGLLGNLKPMLSDGSEIVRENARACIITLAQDFPRAIAEFLQTLDGKVIKMMEHDLPDDVRAEVADCRVRSSSGASALPVPRQGAGGGAGRRSTGSTGAPRLKPRLSGGPARVATNMQLTPEQRRFSTSNASYTETTENGLIRRTTPSTRSAIASRGGGSMGAHRQPAGGSARRLGSYGSSLQPSTPGNSHHGNAGVGVGRSPKHSPRSVISSASAPPRASPNARPQAEALAAMHDVESRKGQSGQSAQPQTEDPADLLFRLQQLRKEVLKISSSRQT